MKRVEIYTDGACSGNPGPGGYGVILKSGKYIIADVIIHCGLKIAANGFVNICCL